MPYAFFDHTGDVGVTLEGPTMDALFAAAALAFTDTVTTLHLVEPKRPEEVDVAAPELDLLMVDFLSELLYRFDTKRWLTREAVIEVREQDGGWALQGTLVGECFTEARHDVKVLIKGVTYHGLEVVERDGQWRGRIVFDI